MGNYVETARLRFPRAAGYGRQYAVAAVVLLLGVAISAWLFLETRGRENQTASMEFREASQDRIANLRKMLEFDILQMSAVRAFFASSQVVTHEEYNAFVTPLLEDHPGIRALQWMPRVLDSERSDYEKATDRDGHRGFQIVGHDDEGRLTAASGRDEYYPILFVEPKGANVAALGFDLATDPACLEAMHLARDTGRVAATDKIPLFGKGIGQTGVRLFFPVYRKYTAMNSVNDRRKMLEGFVVGVLHLRAMVDNSLADLPPAGIDILLIDNTNAGHEQELFFHSSRARAEDSSGERADAGQANRLQIAETLEVAGRRWMIVCSPSPQFIAAMTTWRPWTNAAATLLLTILLASYLIRTAQHNAHTMELASQLALVNARLKHEVADRKRLEVELRKAKETAESSTVAKSRFLATMSHEIRTPMTSILGYADLLADPTLGPSSRQNYLAVIRRSGEHLLMIINDILDLSRIEAGRLSLDIQQCNIVALLADVASVVRPRAEQRGVALTVEYPGPMPEWIMTDGSRLRQAIVNLVGNAVKFTEQGSVRIIASLVTSWRSGESAVQINVIDTGIGIRKEMLVSLFQPFIQGDVSVYQKFGGTGLGLAISHEIARLLGGALTVASRPGQGSTFTLIMPTGSLRDVPMLEHPLEAAHDAAGHRWESSVVDLQGIRILLAEDGYDNRELIQTVLRQAGAKVTSVENGRLAVEQAKAHAFDLILMDMNMPEMDGLAATRILRHDGYTQPILALTANAMTADVERCRQAGCNEHLAKPINRLQLIQTIASYAGRHTMKSGTAQPPASEPAGQPNATVSQLPGESEMAAILGDFVSHLEERVNEMRKVCEGERYDELRQCAHQLKGAGGSYGYPLLSEACATLEEAAKASDPSATAAAIEAIAALCQSIQTVYASRTATSVGT